MCAFTGLAVTFTNYENVGEFYERRNILAGKNIIKSPKNKGVLKIVTASFTFTLRGHPPGIGIAV